MKRKKTFQEIFKTLLLEIAQDPQTETMTDEQLKFKMDIAYFKALKTASKPQ